MGRSWKSLLGTRLPCPTLRDTRLKASFTHSFITKQISNLLYSKMWSFSHYNFSETRMPCNIDIFDSPTYGRSP